MTVELNHAAGSVMPATPSATSARPHVAVLFYRIGPYHHARLKAAGSRLRVTAVEFSNVDPTYAWDLVEGAEGFNRMMLFSGVSVDGQAARNIAHRVAEVLDQLDPQVVAIPGWHDRCSLAALQFCTARGIPVVVMSESTAWDDERTWWKEALKRRVVNLGSAGLVGGRVHADYLYQLGMAREHIFLGYDAVDNAHFATGAAKWQRLKAEARKQYGLPERYFLASARFVEKKNLARLIEAYATYRKLALTPPKSNAQPSTTPWSLVLLGDGPLRSTLNSQLSTLNLNGHVLLPGFKQYDELPVYYGLASAFVHASTIEQWGLVVNEAMASGLPVLVSNRCGCAADLVQEGVNGFTFEPLDVENLAQLMLKLSTLNTQLAAFGAASRELISHWGPERFAEGLNQAVQCVLRVGPPKSSTVQRLILKVILQRKREREVSNN